MHHPFGKRYVTGRRRKRSQRQLDLRVGADRQSDGTRALLKMTFMSQCRLTLKAPRLWRNRPTRPQPRLASLDCDGTIRIGGKPSI